MKMKKLNLLFFIMVLCSGIQSQDPCHSDIDALEAFYTSFGGIIGQQTWTNEVNGDRPWFIDCDPCGEVSGQEWYGIVCEFNKVVQLYFPYANNMVGSIPDSIQYLDKLALLNLGNQSISGGLNPAICECNEMVNISITNSGLDGVIHPRFASDLLDLQTFAIINNPGVTGPMPPFNSSYQHLTNISLYNNSFDGEIPPSYGQLDGQLTQLLTDGNELDIHYDDALASLCPLGFTDEMISDGNIDLIEPWEQFCCDIPEEQTVSFISTPIDCATYSFKSFKFGNTNVVSYNWDFGDSQFSNQAEPTHVYASSGNYEVCVTVEDSNGCINSECQQLVVDVSGTSACCPAVQMIETEIGDILVNNNCNGLIIQSDGGNCFRMKVTDWGELQLESVDCPN